MSRFDRYKLYQVVKNATGYHLGSVIPSTIVGAPFLHPVCKKRSMIKYYLILSDQLSNQSTADQLRVGANRPEAKVRTHKLMMTLKILNRICTCLMFFGGAVSFDQAVSSPTKLFSSILFWCTSLAEIIFRCTLWVHSTKDKNRIESRTDIIFPI